MTRKDYVLLAEVIADSEPSSTLSLEGQRARAVWRHIARNLAQRLHRDNPRFEIDRFLKDCGNITR